MLSERQHFKSAFIARCIEHGYTTPEQIVGQVKEAREKVALTGLLSSLGSGAAGLGAVGLGALTIAPPVAGFLGGTALGSAGNLNDVDSDEVRRKELIEELRRNTERLRRRRPVGG